MDTSTLTLTSADGFVANTIDENDISDLSINIIEQLLNVIPAYLDNRAGFHHSRATAFDFRRDVPGRPG